MLVAPDGLLRGDTDHAARPDVRACRAMRGRSERLTVQGRKKTMRLAERYGGVARERGVHYDQSNEKWWQWRRGGWRRVVGWRDASPPSRDGAGRSLPLSGRAAQNRIRTAGCPLHMFINTGNPPQSTASNGLLAALKGADSRAILHSRLSASAPLHCLVWLCVTPPTPRQRSAHSRTQTTVGPAKHTVSTSTYGPVKVSRARLLLRVTD